MAKWTRDSSGHANKVSEGFKKNLKAVAGAFADQERVDQVSRKHVDDANVALARVGLDLKPWFVRPDTWGTFGGFLIGASISMPDLSGAVLGSLGATAAVQHSFALAGVLVCVIVGSMLFLMANHHNSLPAQGKSRVIVAVVGVAIIIGLLTFVCWRHNANFGGAVVPTDNQASVG